ncbi:MAG: 2-oxo acid dehydrogenase subunit E2 [Pyrinomonadaceae bacterium]|nr:2-oxo acid dehydrogenase subunit E2 [Pyrinomonadaceae bacterium]
MAEFIMPSLGADMTSGTLIEWQKSVGDLVARGEIIAEVDTDKGVIEVEVFTDGVIEKLLIEEGDEVPVGTVLAIIREDGSEPNQPAEETVSETAESKSDIRQSAKDGQRVHASPVARKLANKLGVDLTDVNGSGPNGRIQREDVERTAEKPQTKSERPLAQKTATKDKNKRMRRAIASAMARSKREIPHYYLETTIDLGKALTWLEKENTGRSIKNRILYNVLLLKAVAIALKDFPELNATWENEKLNIKQKINIGIAISLRQGGLISPAILEADRQPLPDLMRGLRELVKRTRSGSLKSSELADSTITVTNLGEQGVETVFGVIYPPQVALIGFGKVYEGVTVRNGKMALSFKINATLAADHRATDGHRGGLFLAAIDRLLQEPEKL